MSSARGSSPSDHASPSSGSPRALSASSSRRSLRSVSSAAAASSSDPAGAHPLLGGGTAPELGSAPGGYAVYDKNSRKQQQQQQRASPGGSGDSSAQSVRVLSPPTSTLSAHEGPLALAPSAGGASTGTTPPPFFGPSSTHSLPPLISRPSSTQLPPPAQGRQYARSVSEAKEQLQRQALKAELQNLGLSAESAGAALVARLGTLVDDADLTSLAAAVRSGKVRGRTALRAGVCMRLGLMTSPLVARAADIAPAGGAARSRGTDRSPLFAGSPHPPRPASDRFGRVANRGRTSLRVPEWTSRLADGRRTRLHILCHCPER